MSAYRSLLGDVFGCAVVACIGAVLAVNHEAVIAFARQQLNLPVRAESDVIAGAQMPEPTEPVRRSLGSVELRADRAGHFSAQARINGRAVDVLVDTGATLVALSYEDAERAGMFVRPSDFTGRVNTANGVARVAPVTLDSVSIGGISVSNVRGVVTERGAMRGTLLGMSFLSKLKKVQMEGGTLVLTD